MYAFLGIRKECKVIMKILFFSPMLGNYYQKICDVLISKNQDVAWNYDSVKMTKFLSVFNKIFPFIKKIKFSKKFKKILMENSHFDQVILINGGDCFRAKHIQKLRQKYPKAKFKYFIWDSIRNYPKVLKFYKLFDQYFSFDKHDCQKYDFEFLPLFYCEKRTSREKQYDLISVMTYKSNKAYAYNLIKNALPSNLKVFEYIYIASKLTFFIDKLFHRQAYKNIDKKNIHFKKITLLEVYDLMAQAKVIIDCPRKNQRGLTIRTFEALALETKIITTNKDVKDYDFYSDNNIFVVENQQNKIPDSFFQTPFDEKHEISEKYSLYSFVEKLFLS